MGATPVDGQRAMHLLWRLSWPLVGLEQSRTHT